MAIATNGGHVNRALDFYNAASKYFIIGGTTPWDNDSTPDTPVLTDFKLRDVIGLKKVDNISMVIPTNETENVISYRSQNWKRVEPVIRTTIGAAGVTAGSSSIPVASIAGLTIGAKLRIANIYEGTIRSITNSYVTLDTVAPVAIPAGEEVIGGAIVEGAKYVYVDCYLNYNEFPLEDSYRQIGLCTGVIPASNITDTDILKSAKYTTDKLANEYYSFGTLEILDNRVSTQRNIDQREHLSIIIEF